MTTLKTVKLNIPSSDLGPESSLPALRSNMRDGYTPPENFRLDEDDGLFIWYGEYPGAFPYRMQDNYDRSDAVREIDALVLENDQLRAVFLPGYGAKLHSLFDKKKGRELLFSNVIIRPCNLAARNAWTAGGIEWNFGFRGHHPYTCSRVNAASLTLDDAAPLLRFYWYERARGCVVQMDVFLPEKSDILYVRTRITNPRRQVVPVYWWTNIAVERKPGDRVIAAADSYYNAEGLDVYKRKIDFGTEKDQTYPNNGIIAKDYFWVTGSDGPRYTAQIGKDGYGLFEASTSMLKGRKLFIWGESEGGRKWQRYLTAEGRSGAYDEIQCGLAHTQYECVPMPPHTCWEWMEAFGPINACPSAVFGDYTDAQEEVCSYIDSKVGFARLEKLLKDTISSAKKPADKILSRSDAFGALELLRRNKSGVSTGLMNPHLDFGDPSDCETSCWISLLESGTTGLRDPGDTPPSYMYQTEWYRLLKKASEGIDSRNWFTFYLLGTYCFYDGNFDDAEKYFKKSITLSDSPWANYCLAILSEEKQDPDSAASYVEKAYALKKDDLSLAKEYVRILRATGHHEKLISVYNTLPEKAAANNRCRLNLAISLAKCGRIKEAENILWNEKDGYLLVPDIREGEESITMLWFEIQKMKGIPAEKAGDPPAEIDFRMAARKNEK